MVNDSEDKGTRQERREQKLKKKKERIAVHGKTIAEIYRNVISKRLKKK